jgi:hypothetical protein
LRDTGIEKSVWVDAWQMECGGEESSVGSELFSTGDRSALRPAL